MNLPNRSGVMKMGRGKDSRMTKAEKEATVTMVGDKLTATTIEDSP